MPPFHHIRPALVCRAGFSSRVRVQVPGTIPSRFSTGLRTTLSARAHPHGVRFASTSDGLPAAKTEPPVDKGEKKWHEKISEWNKRLKWYHHAAIIFVELAICDYYFDKWVLGSSTIRTADAYATLALVGLDYRLNFGRDSWIGGSHYTSGSPAAKESHETALHRRNAERVVAMLKRNGGLYTKFGQALAMQGGVLPEEYQRLFGEMFDDAPQASWKDIEKVVRRDFDGRGVEEVFGVQIVEEGHDVSNASPGTSGFFEKAPKASASIAQVHYARLADGREVAVKVQKPEVAKQVSWDLWALSVMAKWTAWSTGLPVTTIGDFVAQRVMEETDFRNEAANAERMTELLADDPSLGDRVHIPKVYRDLTTEHVYTTEWIHGVTLWDKDKMTAAPAPSPPPAGTENKGGFGLRLDDVMRTVIELFSVQMFRWGFVHCDPHPGNILVRQHPSKRGRAQVVLLDHGLYLTLSDDLRRQYARFWEAMVTGDEAALNKVSAEWGMDNVDAWAEASMYRPLKKAEGQDGTGKKRTEETTKERQDRITREAGAYFGEEGKFPRELLFLERNIALVQGSNRFLGDPVNRIKLIGLCAMRALQEDELERGRGHVGITGFVGTSWRTIRGRFTLAMLDVAYNWSRIRQYFGYGDGFEADLKEAEERQLREMKDTVAELFGVTVD
ncbi:hypothetical protein PspLS_09792 [Pyricularia sp. CBS 133598]|nr:hypothetical protein PspLS_09792 [Pyricularia sp. CBS 133598]